VWETDAAGAVVADSPSWRAYTGQTLSQWLGWGGFDAVHPDDRALAEERWREAVASGRDFDAEFRLLGADGSCRWTNVRAVPIRAPDGGVRKWVGMNIDIDPRRRAEEALRGSRGRLATIFARAAVGLSELSADGRFLEANDELGRLLGRTREELLRLTIADVTHPDDMPRSVQTVAEVLETGAVRSLDKRYARPDGTWVWAQSTISRIEGADGEPRILAVTADLTARRDAEERLRESEARFRTLAQTLPQLVWRAIDCGHWTWASQRWADFTGQSDAQAMDRGWLDAVHPDDRGAVLAAWERAETTDHLEAEVRIRRHDGWYGWFQVEARPVAETHGETAEWCGACSDITVMKALEAELRSGREEAERARAAAEAADAAKTRFLGAVSHDLRQPVMAATLMADLLARRGGDAPEVLDHLRDALGNLSGMLNGLLESARIEAGLVKPEIRAFPLDDVLRRLQSEFEPVARDAGLRLRVASARWDVTSDPLLLELMLRNLLSNAIRFTDAGGVAVEARSLGDAVEVAVADTGRGIPADQINRIFEDFHQLGDPATGRTRGFGIGLSTVRRVADVLGATLDVRSEPGRGSVFAIRLPAAAGDVFAGRTALVVDDDWLVLKGLEMSLEDMGLRVHAARTVREAEQVLARLDQPVAAVVADYTLTGGEVGTEVIAAVRRRDPQAAAILLTGDTSPLRLAEAEGSGYRLVHKPVDPRRLREILASVLRAS
jgi:PAS domain S-box-containing protein